MSERVNRHLDGYFFRVNRDDKWENICFSDLTEQEIEENIGEKSAEWWKSLAVGLANVLREIGDEFDIIGM